MTKKTGKRILSVIMAWLIILSCLVFVPADHADAAPKDEFLSEFKQTVYNRDSGLGSSEVNCIYQTASGYIWIGTDGGLYRFNGKEFRSFNLWNTDKDDVYFINSLYQDSQGRLWVCTDNYGLFYIQGSSVTHFTEDYYNGIKCINDVRETADGTIFVATSDGLFTVDVENTLLQPFGDLNGENIRSLTLAGESLWGLVGGSDFFLLSKQGNIVKFRASEYTQEELSCILGMDDGTIYLGTMGTEIVHINKAFRSTSFSSGRDGINRLYHDGERLFVCADSGMGYFDRQGGFHALYDTVVNKYITDMIVDYEGDYWFASSRLGILLLGQSKFRKFNELYGISTGAVNCVMDGGNDIYIGSDEGMMIVGPDMNMITNSLTEYLNGASVRDVMKDTKGNIWVSTSRRFGVVRYAPNGKIQNFGRSNVLSTNQVNCARELKDGSIAVATEMGLFILEKSGELIRSCLENHNVLCIYEAEDGRIFAGTDGNGIFVMRGERERNYTVNDGLTSNVVTDIVPGNSGIWIGTDNGLSIFTEGIRAVSNIDFSNNVYDLITEEKENGQLRIWIIGSKGVIYATEEELLASEPLRNRYLAQGDGLTETLTMNGKSILRQHLLYLCTASGMLTLNTEKIPVNSVAPRLTVSEINVDDKAYTLDQLGGSLRIASDTQRLSVSFSVLSYINRENIVVEYMLNGFDTAPIRISPSDPMQAVYTNLDGGTYTLTVRAVNGDGIPSEQDITFQINKEFGFFEKQSTKLMLIAAALILVVLVLLGILRLQKRMRGQNREIEKLEKEHEVAVKSSTAKTDFLAHISNEIKIPVNAIISLAETIQREPDENARQESLRAIAASGQDILGKVDETIQLVRLESGRVTVNEAPYSITTLVCDISDRMLNELGKKPVRFLVDLGEKIPDIMVGDYDKLQNILEILLGNAAKYTREGTITLFVDYYEEPDHPDRGVLSFSISDTGIGIQKDRLQHIFEVYNIADNKKQTGYTGSGISLAIAKQLTEIMNGEIEVESTYGAGSTFTITLPQKKPDQSVVTASSSGNAELRVTREEAQRMTASDTAVLLVDDTSISRTVALGVLRQMDIEADVAESGMQALDMVMNRKYDVIFMDLAMPVMNGTDTMKEIRELERDGAQDVPIIAMTEDAINEDREELSGTGFSDMIVKPLELTGLATILREICPEKVQYRTRDIENYTDQIQYQVELQKLEEYLDVTGVLEKIGGSVEVYNRILSTFYNQNQHVSEELQEKLSKSFRSFRSRIHSIRNGAQTIGALELQNLILRIDSAINIGNKNYVRDNLPALITMLEDVLNTIQGYLEFTEQSGYQRGNAPLQEETPAEEQVREPVHRDQVEFSLLDEMLSAAGKEDRDDAERILSEICFDEYDEENTEFIQVMGESVEKNDWDQVKELIWTYKELNR